MVVHLQKWCLILPSCFYITVYLNMYFIKVYLNAFSIFVLTVFRYTIFNDIQFKMYLSIFCLPYK